MPPAPVRPGAPHASAKPAEATSPPPTEAPPPPPPPPTPAPNMKATGTLSFLGNAMPMELEGTVLPSGTNGDSISVTTLVGSMNGVCAAIAMRKWSDLGTQFAGLLATIGVAKDSDDFKAVLAGMSGQPANTEAKK